MADTNKDTKYLIMTTTLLFYHIFIKLFFNCVATFIKFP